MKRYFALLFVMVLLCACTCNDEYVQHTLVEEMDTLNLVENPSFEEGWVRDTTYWTPDGGPYFNEFGEIFTPEGWTTWWYEGFPCATGYTFKTGRPEVQVVDLDTGFPDPMRIRTGTKAVKEFTFWRCHEMGLMQQVDVTAGTKYTLQAYSQAFHSNCSSIFYGPPLDYDCKTPLPDSWDRQQVGIDPYGGIDPRGAGVIWSDAVENYDGYDVAAQLEAVEAMSTTITIFTRSICNYPLKHDDTYFDDVSLVEVHTVYLPLVMKE